MTESPRPLFFDAPDPRNASVAVIAVPFDATCSFRRGSADGPEAVRAASGQCDEVDASLGRIDRPDAAWIEPPAWIRAESDRLGDLARPIVARGSELPEDLEALSQIDAGCERVREYVRARTVESLERGSTPIVLGGEHGVSLGAIEACAETVAELGILQIDAHMDLRRRYLGMAQSHASVMDNALQRAPNVSRLVQVGIRDFGLEEAERAEQLGDRVRTHFDDHLRIAAGDSSGDRGHARSGVPDWPTILAELPEAIYLTLDIDGLDPSLCPNTGTPVPGGLSWRELTGLFVALRGSGKRLVGADLVEVAPHPSADAESLHEDYNAIVGARTLQRLCVIASAMQV